MTTTTQRKPPAGRRAKDVRGMRRQPVVPARPQGRDAELAIIDAVLACDLRAELRARLPGVLLTPRQWDTLEANERFVRDNDYPPTIGELGEVLGIGRIAAYEHLRELRRKCVIVTGKHKARSNHVLWRWQPSEYGDID